MQAEYKQQSQDFCTYKMKRVVIAMIFIYTFAEQIGC